MKNMQIHGNKSKKWLYLDLFIWLYLFYTQNQGVFVFWGFLQFAAQADGFAFDGDGVHILADAQDNRKCGVFRTQFAAVTPVFQIP